MTTAQTAAYMRRKILDALPKGTRCVAEQSIVFFQPDSDGVPNPKADKHWSFLITPQNGVNGGNWYTGRTIFRKHRGGGRWVNATTDEQCKQVVREAKGWLAAVRRRVKAEGGQA